MLAAVTASAIDNVGFRYGYEAFPAYHECGVAPVALAFLARWAVGLATVAAWIAAYGSLVAAWAVEVLCGPSGGFCYVGVELGGLPEVPGGEHGVDAAAACDRVEVVVLPFSPRGCPPGLLPYCLVGVQSREPVVGGDFLSGPWVGKWPSVVFRAGHAGVADCAGTDVHHDDGALAGQALGEGDGAHDFAGCARLVQRPDVSGFGRAAIEDLGDECFGQQEPGGDQVTELFKIASWLVAISEPVECIVVFLGELVAQFVGQGEVLAAAERGWRVEDYAVIEERDPVAPASRIPALSQLGLFPDT